MKIKFTVVILALIVGCQFTRTYLDREADKSAARSTAESFYTAVKAKNFAGIQAVFTKKKFNNVGPGQRDTMLKKLLANIEEKMGPIVLQEFKASKTKVTEGSKHAGEYLVAYHIKRQNQDCEDIFTMVLEDDQVKIVDYNIRTASL